MYTHNYYCVYMYSTGKCVHYTGSTHSYHHSTHICEESLLKHYILGVDVIMLHNGHPLSHANTLYRSKYILPIIIQVQRLILNLPVCPLYTIGLCQGNFLAHILNQKLG